MSNIVLKCVDELLIGFHTLDICNKGFRANKNLCMHLPTIDSRSIGINGIGSDRFIPAMDISKHGIRGLEATFQVKSTHQHLRIYWVVRAKVSLTI